MTGETIRQRLSIIGTTQAELARLLEVTPQAITGILAAFDLRTSTIERISEALNLPITFFYGEEETDALNNLEQLKAKKVEKIWQTQNIEEKVRLLLREQKKKFASLCEYVGMTDPGMRKVFARDTCHINTLTKLAEYFSVPVSYFLPEGQPLKEEREKDRELEYLRGQVKAYENAFALLTKETPHASL